MKLLPDSLRVFAINRALEFSGLLIAFLSIFVFTSIISYSPFDPNINNLNNSEVRNLTGLIGANVSNVLLQMFGYFSLLICPVLISWSYKIFFTKKIRFFALNILLLPLMIIVLSIFSELIQLSSSNGFIASQIVTYLVNSNLIENNYIFYSLASFSFLLFLLFFYGSMGLSANEWSNIYLFLIVIFNFLIKPTNRLRFFKKYLTSISPLRKTFNQTEVNNQKLEPKINFDEIKNQPVNDFIGESNKDVLLEEQNEIFVDDINYKAPGIDILTRPDFKTEASTDHEELKVNAEKLKNVLIDFKIEGDIINVSPGPIVTMYELQPAPGIKASKIISLSDDIARNMSAMSARVAIIPGKNVIGIEIPNSLKNPVYLSELFKNEKFVTNEKNLILALGKDISGNAVFANLENMPHLLIAGTTGSGKSVGINVMITSILYKHSPDDCKFILIDPKMLELSVYEGVPHLITPVVTDPKKAITALKWVVREMESRYKKMSLLGVRNIENYNIRIADAIEKSERIIRSIQSGISPETGQPETRKIEIENKKMPFIVVVVDEMADLMMVAGKEIEHTIQRLSQMARAAGIHLIMATQRPSVDVITGTIKANFPSRISFQVSSKFDSRTILGEEGAERLLGKGDMLMMTAGGQTTRIHGPFISDNEIENIVKSLQKQGQPEYDDEITKEEEENNDTDNTLSDGDKDALFKDSIDIISREGKASTSLLQRKLQIGYNRAARIMDQLEEQGYISTANHVGKREINYDKFTN
ncbi:DNA translocase FtsK 4TM domain-containing protein [Pelagibacteraceae bacterium]|nr:DNA translocase FtsK 4TM domain-containing protein [Pelagibacteraceae bacterium]